MSAGHELRKLAEWRLPENTGRFVHMVGTIFRKEDYGIVFRQGSPRRKQVNNALLSLREDGSYQQLYDKWFTAK